MLKSKKKTASQKRYFLLQIVKIKKLFLLLIFSVIVLMCVTGKTSYMYCIFKNKFYNFTSKYNYKFDNLTISGIQNLDKNLIINAIQAQPNQSIFLLNLKDIQQRIKKINWVKSVIVELKLPNSLYIAIQERQPIAIWNDSSNKKFLVDCEGCLLSINNINVKDSQLVTIDGDNAPQFSCDLIRNLNYSKPLMSYLVSATLQGSRRWDLCFNNGLIVKMPSKNFINAWHYLDKL